MKLKKLISSLICTSLVLSSFVVVSANNVIVNESPINETDASTGTENEWSTDESNLADVEVTYTQSSNYVVTIPKTIALDSKKQATYSIKVTGDIDTNQRVYVSPVDVISDTEEVDFYMKDQNSKKDDVIATVTQNKIYWSSDEVSNGYEETDNSISVPGLTSGTWKGTFQVEIKLQSEASHEHHFIDGKCECGEIDSNHTHNYVDGVCDICKRLQPGLYDADDNLLVNWEDSGIEDDCSNAKSVMRNTYPKSTKVVISDSVTNIGIRAFVDCTLLTNVEIPNSVTNIGTQAFTNCTSLTNVEIPNSVASIGEQAFANCTSLTNVEIPNSVTNIGASAFENCSSLDNVEISNLVTSIGKYAFANCTSLTNIEIPNSVTSINYCAFGGCTSLTNIEIPNSVTSIGEYAFENCTSLTNIVIPDSVIQINNLAFSNVPHITYYGTATGSPWGAKSIN